MAGGVRRAGRAGPVRRLEPGLQVSHLNTLPSASLRWEEGEAAHEGADEARGVGKESAVRDREAKMVERVVEWVKKRWGLPSVRPARWAAKASGCAVLSFTKKLKMV